MIGKRQDCILFRLLCYVVRGIWALLPFLNTDMPKRSIAHYGTTLIYKKNVVKPLTSGTKKRP